MIVKVDPRRHPSGKPIRRTERVGCSLWRVPNDGPVIPRLQRQETGAIGFTVGRLPGGDETQDD
jgi:hypothetical protein